MCVTLTKRAAFSGVATVSFFHWLSHSRAPDSEREQFDDRTSQDLGSIMYADLSLASDTVRCDTLGHIVT